MLRRYYMPSAVLRSAVAETPFRRCRRSDEDGENGEEEGAPASASWTENMSKTIGRLYVKLQNSLLNDALIKYYVEWCATPDRRRAGFCTLDFCVAFNETGAGLTPRKKAADNDIYVCLPHRILGPLPAAAQDRVNLFWSTTFFCQTTRLLSAS